MNKTLVIITGHLDTNKKTKICLELIEKLDQKYDICYSTHHQKIDQRIIEKCDYVAYEKTNPILNYDICDDFTKHYYAASEINGLGFIVAYKFHHGFAHLRLILSGLHLGLLNKYDNFHIMNSDLKIEFVNKLVEHDILMKDNFSVFYTNGDEKGQVNTEFFSIKNNLATKLLTNYHYSSYKKNKSVILESNLYNFLVLTNYDIILLEKPIKESLGRTLWSENIQIPTRFFSHYIEDLIYIPFYHNEKFHLLIQKIKHIAIPEQKNKKIDLMVNDEIIFSGETEKLMNAESILLSDKINFNLKIYLNEKLCGNFLLDNIRQFGTLIE